MNNPNTDYDNFYLEGTTIGISWSEPDNTANDSNTTDDYTH